MTTFLRDYVGTYDEVYPDIVGVRIRDLDDFINQYLNQHQVPTDLAQQINDTVVNYCAGNQCELVVMLPGSRGFWLCAEEDGTGNGLPGREFLMEGFMDAEQEITYVLPNRNIVVPQSRHLTRTIRNPEMALIRNENGGTRREPRPTLGSIPRIDDERLFDYTRLN